MSYESHDFYCCNCGRLGLPVLRAGGRMREQYHLKNLYCPHCKQEYNHVEIRTPQEKQVFIENFNQGVYENVKNYISDVRTGRRR